MGIPVSGATPDDVVRTADGEPAFAITRTTRGWAVLTPAGTEHTPDLVEAMSLADLIAEDLGTSPEPGRDARRAARGGAPDAPDADPRDEELAALRRSVAQLEHALAARVSVERAIGVLAVQQGCCPRQAFEQLRHRARSSGRPVHDLAREVLDGLGAGPAVPPPAGPSQTESLAGPERPARRRVERNRARQPVLVEGER
ncbi:ANTAR domain-containing protein [Klenkia soli]|uniref:ANTAR domain-containing protein n=1 Tax=Klenkia soli TaxID=1052260 RepID=A0A1H0HES7_9ACTN|nr:ANTAR domain-containing protein [Klenkia soli]SDO17672.1 ANTAR domain-containing protein [Klenkia soli]